MAPSARSPGYSTPQPGRTSDEATRPLTAPDRDDGNDLEDAGMDSDDAELLAAEAHVGSQAGGSSTNGVRDGEASGGAGSKSGVQASSTTYASPYRLSTSERARGLANRILFSRYYIIFYLVMTGLSLATVILSLKEGDCPGTAWHILEIIVNGGMILEVGTRWVGFGKQYPMTALNIIDLLLTAFCVITLMVVFLSSCGGSKGEEVLDTVLLVVRNGVQFWRLGTILRRSGHSLLHAPKPIDLSQARAAAFDLDLNLDDDEALAEHHLNSRPIGASAQLGQAGSSRTYFDAADELENADVGRMSAAIDRQAVIGDDRSKGQVGYNAGRQNLTEDQEAQWDRMG